MLTTLITLARFSLSAVAVGALYLGSRTAQLIGVGVLLLGLALDTLDGAVARRRHETTLAGSVLDIAADRTYELVLWMCFADLGLISLLIPIIVIVRTALTDALRRIEVQQGTAPFEQPGTRLTRFLVASSWMRSAYGLVKILAFMGLALVQALGRQPGASGPGAPLAVQALAWLCLLLCLLRGAPVVLEGLRHHAAAWAGVR